MIDDLVPRPLGVTFRNSVVSVSDNATRIFVDHVPRCARLPLRDTRLTDRVEVRSSGGSHRTAVDDDAVGDQDQVTGPELMLKFCEMSCRKGYSNFFYGGRPGVAEQLKASFIRRFPGLNVVGTYCPPFRPLNTEEQSELRNLFARLKPDITWVGLGGPKQDMFMAEQLEKLEQLRVLSLGHTIRVGVVPHASIGVDTPADYEQFVAAYRSRREHRAA